MFKKTLSLAALGLVSLSAFADIIPYPTPGVVNPNTYTFTATGPGPITAYFYGSSAGYGSLLGLSINGAAPLTYGLQDNSTMPGTAFVLGTVLGGETLRFVLAVNKSVGTGPTAAEAIAAYGAGSGPGVNYYLNSDETLNPDFGSSGGHHIYSTPFSGGTPPIQAPFLSSGPIPAGTYVAFEDILLDDPTNDRDYNDHQFVFTGITEHTNVPDGGMTLTLLGMALTGLAFVRRKF